MARPPSVCCIHWPIGSIKQNKAPVIRHVGQGLARPGSVFVLELGLIIQVLCNSPLFAATFKINFKMDPHAWQFLCGQEQCFLFIGCRLLIILTN